jgi:hypothetical protein
MLKIQPADGADNSCPNKNNNRGLDRQHNAPGIFGIASSHGYKKCLQQIQAFFSFYCAIRRTGAYLAEMA